MSLTDVVFGELPSFRDNASRNMKFVRLLPNDHLLCWHVKMSGIGASDMESICLILHPTYVATSVLKQLGIWDSLQEHTRKMVDSGIVNGDIINDECGKVVGEVVGEGRRGRRSRGDYADLPREIPCVRCGNPEYIAPAILVQKVGLDGLDAKERGIKLQLWLEGHYCGKCKPRRKGRERNPLYVDIPRVVNCSKCGKECGINAKGLYEETGGDKDKIKLFVDKYLCRKCNPEWGKWLRGKRKGSVEKKEKVVKEKVVGGRRGRKPNPENVGFPKKVRCTVCNDEVGIAPKQIKGKAEKLGMTVEALLLGYKCRKCGGRIKKGDMGISHEQE